MQSNNGTNDRPTAAEDYANLMEEVPSEFPNATKSRISTDEPDSESNWMHTHTVLRRGINSIEAVKAGLEPWKVVVQVDSESASAAVDAHEITGAIAEAHRYISARSHQALPHAVESSELADTDMQALLFKVTAAAPKWALAPTAEDLSGAVNGEIEVQYDGPNFADDNCAGWTTRAHLSQTIVFTLDGEIVETLPVEPFVLIENPGPHAVNAGDEAANDLQMMKALMTSGSALMQLANALAEVRLSEMQGVAPEGS